MGSATYGFFFLVRMIRSLKTLSCFFLVGISYVISGCSVKVEVQVPPLPNQQQQSGATEQNQRYIFHSEPTLLVKSNVYNSGENLGSITFTTWDNLRGIGVAGQWTGISAYKDPQCSQSASGIGKLKGFPLDQWNNISAPGDARGKITFYNLSFENTSGLEQKIYLLASSDPGVWVHDCWGPFIIKSDPSITIATSIATPALMPPALPVAPAPPAPPMAISIPPVTVSTPPIPVSIPPALPVALTPPVAISIPPVTVSTRPITVSIPPVAVSAPFAPIAPAPLSHYAIYTPPVSVSIPPVTVSIPPVSIAVNPTLTAALSSNSFNNNSGNEIAQNQRYLFHSNPTILFANNVYNSKTDLGSITYTVRDHTGASVANRWIKIAAYTDSRCSYSASNLGHFAAIPFEQWNGFFAAYTDTGGSVTFNHISFKNTSGLDQQIYLLASSDPTSGYWVHDCWGPFKIEPFQNSNAENSFGPSDSNYSYNSYSNQSYSNPMNSPYYNGSNYYSIVTADGHYYSGSSYYNGSSNSSFYNSSNYYNGQSSSYGSYYSSSNYYNGPNYSYDSSYNSSSYYNGQSYNNYYSSSSYYSYPIYSGYYGSPSYSNSYNSNYSSSIYYSGLRNGDFEDNYGLNAWNISGNCSDQSQVIQDDAIHGHTLGLYLDGKTYCSPTKIFQIVPIDPQSLSSIRIRLDVKMMKQANLYTGPVFLRITTGNYPALDQVLIGEHMFTVMGRGDEKDNLEEFSLSGATALPLGTWYSYTSSDFLQDIPKGTHWIRIELEVPGGGQSGWARIDNVTLIPNDPIVLSASVLSNNSGDVPLTVNFNGSSPELRALRQWWDFGNGPTDITSPHGGTTSNIFSPSFTYTATGTYYASFSVQDDQGVAKTVFTKIIAQNACLPLTDQSIGQANNDGILYNTITFPQYCAQIKISPTLSSNWSYNNVAGVYLWGSDLSGNPMQGFDYQNLSDTKSRCTLSYYYGYQGDKKRDLDLSKGIVLNANFKELDNAGMAMQGVAGASAARIGGSIENTDGENFQITCLRPYNDLTPFREAEITELTQGNIQFCACSPHGNNYHYDNNGSNYTTASLSYNSYGGSYATLPSSAKPCFSYYGPVQSACFSSKDACDKNRDVFAGQHIDEKVEACTTNNTGSSDFCYQYWGIPQFACYGSLQECQNVQVPYLQGLPAGYSTSRCGFFQPGFRYNANGSSVARYNDKDECNKRRDEFTDRVGSYLVAQCSMVEAKTNHYSGSSYYNGQSSSYGSYYSGSSYYSYPVDNHYYSGSSYSNYNSYNSYESNSNSYSYTNSSNPSRLNISGPSSYTAGSCVGPFYIYSQDQYGHSINVGSTVNINLSAYPTGGGFYSDSSSCSNAVSSITIATGNSSSTLLPIFYKSPYDTDVTITASDASYLLSSGTLTISHSARTGFGTGHLISVPFGMGSVTMGTAAVQADGKILYEGGTNSYATTGDSSQFQVARYNSDGTLDLTFGYYGSAKADCGASCWANGAAVQADQKIIAIGGTYPAPNPSAIMMRINSDGSFDPTFSKVTLPDVYGFTQVVIQSNGQILAQENGSKIDRFNTNGTLDTTFGSSGHIAAGSTFALQSNQQIVTIGYSSGLQIMRFNADGSVDTNFGSSGYAVIPGALSNYEDAGVIAIQPSDQKILIAGRFQTGSTNQFRMARFTTTGSIDTTFGTNGVYTGSSNTSVGLIGLSTLLVLSNGNIFGVGGAGTMEWHPNGTVDSSYIDQVGMVGCNVPLGALSPTGTVYLTVDCAGGGTIFKVAP